MAATSLPGGLHVWLTSIRVRHSTSQAVGAIQAASVIAQLKRVSKRALDMFDSTIAMIELRIHHRLDGGNFALWCCAKKLGRGQRGGGRTSGRRGAHPNTTRRLPSIVDRPVITAFMPKAMHWPEETIASTSFSGRRIQGSRSQRVANQHQATKTSDVRRRRRQSVNPSIRAWHSP
ncbi:hypothetical protein OPT61_g9682 [Boeremia exigua]|uniref:Uncharacterized protein n=1 Tax=Boeremia exigua TaxID=749465 RepID=A0ACC2HT06_9PLEO|nr:hypothetical protein OPT61_g9682 [Boeremia exigua]